MKAVVATICAVLSVLAAAPASAETTPVLRILDYPGGSGFVQAKVAVAKGMCKARGVVCERKVIPNGVLGMQMLLAGDINVYGGPAETILQAVSRGAKLKVIGSSFTEPIFYLVASTRVPMAGDAVYPESIRKLKNRKIGVPARGTGAEFQLVSLLQDAGLAASDVTIVPVGPPDTALTALVNGQVDLLMLYDPIGGICEVRKVCRIIADPRRKEGPADLVLLGGAANPVAVTADFATKHPDAVKAFTAAMEDARAWMSEPANFPELMSIVRSHYAMATPDGEEIQERVLKAQLARGAYRWRINPQALQAAADYLSKTQQLKSPMDTRSLLLDGVSTR